MLLSTVDIQNSIQPDVAPGFAFKLLPWKPRAIFSGVYLSDFVKKKCPKQNTHLTHLTHILNLFGLTNLPNLSGFSDVPEVSEYTIDPENAKASGQTMRTADDLLLFRLPFCPHRPMTLVL
jgi:hypothetical protein